LTVAVSSWPRSVGSGSGKKRICACADTLGASRYIVSFTESRRASVRSWRERRSGRRSRAARTCSSGDVSKFSAARVVRSGGANIDGAPDGGVTSGRFIRKPRLR
jgi:hypothetical protein